MFDRNTSKILGVFFILIMLVIVFFEIIAKKLSDKGRIFYGIFLCVLVILIVIVSFFYFGVFPNEWMYGDAEQSSPVYYCVSDYDGVIISKDCNETGAYSFLGNKSITAVRFENDDTKISERSFFDCAKLSYINLPKNIKIIPSFSFAFCKSLSAISIPKDVKTIEKGAFLACEALEKVILYNTACLIDKTAFLGCGKPKDPKKLEGVLFVDGKSNVLDRQVLSKIFPGLDLDKQDWLANLKEQRGKEVTN